MLEQKKNEPKGSCVIAIRFECRAEYLKWKKYCDPGRRWEFEVEFPAILRMDYPFESALDVNILSVKIVQLLQMGFNVYSAEWRLSQ